MKIALEPWAFEPTRAHPEDAGLDLKTPIGLVIEPKTAVVIDTGVHVEIPRACAGVLVSKSGLNVKHGITSTGLIDEGYTGSIAVKLYNHGNKTVEIPKGGKVSQLVIIPVLQPKIEIVDKIDGGKRGDNGFGSSGV